MPAPPPPPSPSSSSGFPFFLGSSSALRISAWLLVLLLLIIPPTSHSCTVPSSSFDPNHCESSPIESAADMSSTVAAAAVKRVPPLFISHGGPNLYLTKDESYKFYHDLGKTIKKEHPDLRAIVIVSAHWETDEYVRVNTSPNPPQIYDFYGFPKEMYEFKYRPTGNEAVSRRVIELLEVAKIPVKEDREHGLDHGAWSPLSIVFPKADIPMIQVSLMAPLDPKFHLKVGQALSSLQYENVLVIGSGSATHNLRDLFRGPGGSLMGGGEGPVLEYAKEFDGHLRELVTKYKGEERNERLSKIYSHPLVRRAHPTTEHLAPIFIAAGAGFEELGKSIHERLVMGALSMACYTF